MLLSKKSLKEFTHTQLKLRNNFNQVAGYKVKVQKAIAFLSTIKEQAKDEIFKKLTYNSIKRNKIPCRWKWKSLGHVWPHGLYSPWDFPGQNTGVGSLSLLQGVFPTQGSN